MALELDRNRKSKYHEKIIGPEIPKINNSYKPLDQTWLDPANISLDELLDLDEKKKPKENQIFELILTGHAETTSVEKGLLTGFFSGELSDKGKKQATEQKPENDALVFVSDLPRALEHAIREHVKRDTTDKMDDLKRLDELMEIIEIESNYINRIIPTLKEFFKEYGLSENLSNLETAISDLLRIEEWRQIIREDELADLYNKKIVRPLLKKFENDNKNYRENEIIENTIKEKETKNRPNKDSKENTYPDKSYDELLEELKTNINNNKANIIYTINRNIRNNPTLSTNLEKIVNKIKYKEVNPKIHNELIELALKYNLIPMPLIRAQYFGDLELIEEKNIKQIIEAIEKKSQKEQERIYYQIETNDPELGYLIHRVSERRRINGIPYDLEKKINAESYTRFKERIDDALNKILSSFSEERNKIEIVGHSGHFDIIKSYLRTEKTDELSLRRTKTPDSRGQQEIFKIKYSKGRYMWVNDPSLFNNIIKYTQKNIEQNILRSLGNRLKNKEQIFTVPLKNNNEITNIDKIIYNLDINNPEKIIIFGNSGQGKSMIASEIARKFLENLYPHKSDKNIIPDFEEIYNKKTEVLQKYVPLLINLGKITEKANIANRTIKEIIESEMNNEVGDYFKRLDEIRKEYKIVFIIDDYRRGLNTKEIDKVLNEIKKPGDLEIKLIRSEIKESLRDTTPFTIYNIDKEEIAKQTIEYAKSILNENELKEYKKEIKEYDSDITGNYITGEFLVRLFSKENKTEILENIINDALAIKIKNGELLSKVEVYEAYCNYQNGKSLKQISLLKDRNLKSEITRLEKELANKAMMDFNEECKNLGIMTHPFPSRINPTYLDDLISHSPFIYPNENNKQQFINKIIQEYYMVKYTSI